MSPPSTRPADGLPDPTLARLQRLAEDAGQAELARAVARIAEGLGRRELTVAVLGQFKRGKSSLLNALAGQEALPTGILPTTSVATCLVRGDPELRLTGLDGRRWTAPLAELAEFVSEQRNPGNRRGLARAEVAVPLPAWAEGITFVDSPGVGSAHDANTEAARALLPGVDAAIFVLSPDPPITAEELAFLREAQVHATKFFFVVNKIDLLTPAERTVLLDYLRAQLAERCGFPAVRFYLTSCRDGGGATPVTGLRELADGLREHLGVRREEAVRSVTAARARLLAARLRAQIELATRTAALSREERAGRLATLARQVEDLRTEHRALQALVAEEVLALVQSLPGRIHRTAAPEIGPVVAALDRRIPELRARTSGGLASAFDQELRERFRPAADRLRRSVTEEVVTELDAQARLLEGRLRRWAEELREVVAREFGVALPPLTVDAEPLGPERFRDRIEGLYEGTLVGQTGLILPAVALRGRLRRRLQETVESEFEAFGGRLRSDLADRIGEASSATRERVADRLARDLKLVEEAVEAGRTADTAGRPGAESWEGRMRGLAREAREIEGVSTSAGSVAA